MRRTVMVAGDFKGFSNFFLGFFLILFAGFFAVFSQNFFKNKSGMHIKTASPRLPILPSHPLHDTLDAQARTPNIWFCSATDSE